MAMVVGMMAGMTLPVMDTEYNSSVDLNDLKVGDKLVGGAILTGGSDSLRCVSDVGNYYYNDNVGNAFLILMDGTATTRTIESNGSIHPGGNDYYYANGNSQKLSYWLVSKVVTNGNTKTVYIGGTIAYTALSDSTPVNITR
ncbi:MAG: hypothetical protein K6G84_11450 [Lachnospiraceae bacterium]|nr:hypothetical protein [Lachnospiraceae bacterium]